MAPKVKWQTVSVTRVSLSVNQLNFFGPKVAGIHNNMATIVVETAAAAENLGTGLDWLNPTNALVDDVLSASVVFDGISTESKMLWVHDFGFSIPTDPELILKGIKAKILRTGSGETEDFEVFLTYGPTPSFTTPSKHQPGFWADDVDGTANYGGLGDIWNRTWAIASQINDSQFGLAISAESPDNLDAGLIDFVEISIFYIHQFDEAAVGGSSGGGSADVSQIVNSAKPQGGALGGGHGGLIFSEFPAGGVLAGGTADGFFARGGILTGGTATDLLIYVHPITGGALAGGLADPDFADIVEVGGGALVGGIAVVPVHSIMPIGGILVAAPIVFDYTSNPITGGGGIVLDAAAFVDPVLGKGGALVLTRSDEASKFTIYNPVLPAGGVLAGGTTIISHLGPADGGVIAAGVALYSKRYDEVAPGGALTGGAAKVEPFIEDGTGGAVAGGQAIVEPFFEFGSGGAFAGGVARITFNYDTDLNPNELQVIARGKFFVPPDPTTKTAVCSFVFDPGTNILTWHIVHSMGSELSVVRVRGPAEPGEAGGGVIVSIDTLQDVTVSPIEGSEVLTAGEAADYQNGLHWILLRTIAEADKMRAQIRKFDGLLVGGTALISHDGEASGGTTVGGSADLELFVIPPITGGAGVGSPGGDGVPIFKLVTIITTGGALAGGITVLDYTANVLGTGGAIVGGLAINQAVFFNVDGIGGAIVAGRGVIGISPKIGGGGISSGLVAIAYISSPVITGGGLVGGKARQTFTDFFVAIGHILVGGQSLPAKIKFFNTQRLGYGRAMGSDNILTVIPDDTVKLIPPTDDVSPELKESRFRIQHNPGWCDVPVKCENGVLPEVIVKRQKGIVPPKIRQDTPRASSIVSAL